MVRITASRLHPETIELRADETLAWVNYSNRAARISFDSSVATKLHCKHGASFRLNGERLESRDVRGRQFASLCQLEPGEYTYRVELVQTAGSIAPAGDRVHEGRIVVR